ncbi:hypothetical protein QAD02_004070 [Eretmocerus hayati]|uniref:Uncharacterized protein n=1 Tax=Eretmocerus hayati TaxID=131215 RepID=A0ACC2NTD3_9HYME|nr:hypothetical protein QAD02_004070 [Eretmocerus hayati]
MSAPDSCNLLQTLKSIVQRRRRELLIKDAAEQAKNDAVLARLGGPQQWTLNGVGHTETNRMERLEPSEVLLSENNGAESLDLNGVQALDLNGVEDVESDEAEPLDTNEVITSSLNDVKPLDSNKVESPKGPHELPRPSLTKTPAGILIPVGLKQPQRFPCYRCQDPGHGFETCSRYFSKTRYFCIYCGENGVSSVYCACKLGKGQFSLATPEEMTEAILARKRHRERSYQRRSTSIRNNSSNYQRR